MQVRVFTLRFNPAIDAFEDAAVTQFLADKEVCSIRDHFFVKDDTPYLSLVVCYRPRPVPPPPPEAQGAGRRRDESWRDLLSKEDWPLFNTLRDWRAERAKADGIPPYVECDVRKFFASVDHDRLHALLRRMFKDEPLLDLLGRILAHAPPGAEPGRDLPIGNLTSQHFANLYLGELDHHLEERERVRGYLRYMDDLLLFADDKARLHLLLVEIRRFLAKFLALSLKEEATRLAPVSEGIPFLGFRIYPGLIRLSPRTLRRQWPDEATPAPGVR